MKGPITMDFLEKGVTVNSTFSSFLRVVLYFGPGVCVCVCVYVCMYVCMYIVLFGPVKPELGVIPSGQENHSQMNI